MDAKGYYFWALLDKVGTVLLSFSFNLVMARWFLSPHEFGLIGLLQIFISLGYTTTIAGFGQTIVQTASLQKKDIDTVFTTNLLIAAVVYLLFLAIAPGVASFYEEPILADVLRVLGLQPLICSFFIIQYNLALRAMELKKLCLVSLLSSLSGYIVGLLLAMYGAGVWSLVAATLSIFVFQNIGLWLTSKVFPALGISRDSFRKLIPYSSFIYFATIVEQVYIHGLALVLGKQFTVSTVGYYTQANKLQQVPSSAIQDVGYQVLFPKLSRLYAEEGGIAEHYRRNSRLITAVSVLVFSVLFVIAKAAVLILYSEKWAASVPILRILTPVGLFLILSFIPTILIRGVGDAKGFFYISAAEKLGGLLILLGLSFVGLEETLWGMAGVTVIAYLINIFYASRVTDVTLKAQLSDVLTLLIPQGVIVAGIDLLVKNMAFQSLWSELLVGVSLSVVAFVLLLKVTGYVDIKNLVRLVVK